VSAPISKDERVKLAKLLGMLGSNHSGERDAAGLAAHRFLQQRGLTWPRVLEPPAIEQCLPELGTWRQTCRECLEHPGMLRAWGKSFLADLPGFRRLSVKQRYVLNEIADRVLGPREARR
jgi:hypothetical protein